MTVDQQCCEMPDASQALLKTSQRVLLGKCTTISS